MSEELNRKLAEWTGAKGPCWACEGMGRSTILGNCSVCDATGKLPLENGAVCPDFTHSLDACFKWLVPEAHKRELEIRLWSFYDLSNDKFFYFSHLQNPKGEVQCASMVGEEEAAMSVCRTFEMLIDEEAKDADKGTG